MSIKLDNLETFKKLRNEISESLTSEFVGREKEIDDICNLLSQKNFLAITGPAGIGKSRLAVAAIEKYVSEQKGVTVLCVKSFGDYISAIEESIEESKEYLFLIDDANNYKRLDELMECLKYHRESNVKAIFTVRDYLKGCIDDTQVVFYEVGVLNDDEIEKAIEENFLIKNQNWLHKISNISKGNIRFAFVATDTALKKGKVFASFFNVKDIMNIFYKEQIQKMDNSNNLLIVAGIISFFKSVYLNQLFYISPVLKIVGISKQEFLRDIDALISMEVLDECIGVVKVSDQCFADYLLNYVFAEKKYIKIKDLIVNTYRYYKKRIIESLNIMLNTYLTEELISYVKRETYDACLLIEDIELIHDIEIACAPLALDYVALEFKKGVEDYTDKKDIEWLLKLFSSLSKSEYCSVAVEGIMRLLKKTKEKKTNVFQAINDTFSLDYGSVKSLFRYLDLFVSYLTDHEIYDERFLLLISSYLKYSFKNSRFVDEKKLEFCSFNISDDMNGIVSFRKKCWNYLFGYSTVLSLDAIMDFVRYHISKNTKKIILADLESINEYLINYENKELIQSVLYEELKDDAKKYSFEKKMFSSEKYSDILSVLLERKIQGQSYEAFRKTHEVNVHNLYRTHKTCVFEILKKFDFISKYYSQNIEEFLLIILDCLDEFSPFILNLFIQYHVYPRTVVEKASSIIGLDELYEEIKSINDASMKEEYLYSFYSLINDLGEKDTWGFDAWIKSKQNLNVGPVFKRDVHSLKKIAENSGISYLKLVKVIFKKRANNENIVKEYLSYLFFKNGAFKELLGLDRNLAINIYEFLIAHGENDYGNRALKEIINAKRSYIKIFAKRYIEDELIDEEGLGEIVFDGNNCNSFFKTCVEIGIEKLPYFVPFNLQQFISLHLDRQDMLDWIFVYIDENCKDDCAMESLFTILAGINTDYRNRFLVKYYEKGKDEKVLKCALLSESGPIDSTESYFKSKIKSLQSLKLNLIKWDNLNLISFIDELIEGSREDLMNSKISQMIEYIDPSLMAELQEIDLKTEVSLSDAFKLYVEDENFRRLLSSGYVSYKDGNYVTKSDTPLKFSDVFKDKKILGIKTIPVKEDEKVRFEEYLSSMKHITCKFADDRNATLDDCLIRIFAEREWKAADFEQETFLSRDIFSKIRNNKRNKLDKKTIIKILIGLRLPKIERDFLLELNGTQLSGYIEEDALYSFILDSKIDIGSADELLRKLGKDWF